MIFTIIAWKPIIIIKMSRWRLYILFFQNIPTCKKGNARHSGCRMRRRLINMLIVICLSDPVPALIMTRRAMVCPPVDSGWNVWQSTIVRLCLTLSIAQIQHSTLMPGVLPKFLVMASLPNAVFRYIYSGSGRCTTTQTQGFLYGDNFNHHDCTDNPCP